MFTFYLLHFTRPLGHARHYAGYTSLPLADRLARHRGARGAALIRALLKSGGDFVVAWTCEFRTGEEARDFERQWKRRGGSTRRCPLCRGASGDTVSTSRTALGRARGVAQDDSAGNCTASSTVYAALHGPTMAPHGNARGHVADAPHEALSTPVRRHVTTGLPAVDASGSAQPCTVQFSAPTASSGDTSRPRLGRGHGVR